MTAATQTIILTAAQVATLAGTGTITEALTGAVTSQSTIVIVIMTPAATASASGTSIVAGSTAALTDASGNQWTITASGQVAVNGVTDTTTANVTELAYVSGLIWQKNKTLWWSKTAPSAAWLPTAGTAVSPLA